MGSPSVEQKVMDAEIAAEIFIDRRLEQLQPEYKPPARSNKGTIELLYGDGLLAIKGRNIR